MRPPHDRLVKKALSPTENAEGELRLMLPAALAARLDWSTPDQGHNHRATNLETFNAQ